MEFFSQWLMCVEYFKQFEIRLGFRNELSSLVLKNWNLWFDSETLSQAKRNSADQPSKLSLNIFKILYFKGESGLNYMWTEFNKIYYVYLFTPLEVKCRQFTKILCWRRKRIVLLLQLLAGSVVSKGMYTLGNKLLSTCCQHFVETATCIWILCCASPPKSVELKTFSNMDIAAAASH